MISYSLIKNYKQKRLLATFCLILISAIGFSNSERTLVDSVKISGDHFKVDILGNIYWTKNNTLNKYSPDTREITEYTNTTLGKIEKYDVSNPLKILIYYDTHNQILYLDKNLAEIISPLSLDQTNIPDVYAVCTSHRGGFWILNPVSQKIEHYNENLRITTESSTFTELFKEDNIKIQLTEKNNKLYCFIEDCCLWTFDLYGNYLKKHPLKNVNNIQIINGNIFYFYKSTLNKYNINTLEKDTLAIPAKRNEWENVKTAENGLIYTLKDQKVYIYK
ncbi:MAG: hypothetical protein ACQESJ_03775 [Bacteroidota bacterium]